MNSEGIIRNLNRYLLKDRKLNDKEELWIRNVTKIVEEVQAKIGKIKESLAPWIGDQLDAVIADIEQETTPEPGSGGGETAEEISKKKLTEWENLQKEVKKLFQKDELIGLDKVAADKEKIRQEIFDENPAFCGLAPMAQPSPLRPQNADNK